MWFLGILVAVSLLVFFTFLVIDRNRVPEITFLSSPNAEIAVDIQGAIATPGVVYLPPGSRMIDVISAAGGLTVNADTSLINQSARVSDGQMIVLPTVPAAGDDTHSNLLNINTATADELTELPGVGDVLATRIVEYRDTHGPFQSIDDLGQVEGISTTLIESLRPLVSVAGGD